MCLVVCFIGLVVLFDYYTQITSSKRGKGSGKPSKLSTATPVCVCVLEWEYTPTSDVVGIQDKKKRTKPKEYNTQNSMCSYN